MLLASRISFLIAVTGLLTACGTAREPERQTYYCEDGRQLVAKYFVEEDPDHVRLFIDSGKYDLYRERSADGVRYTTRTNGGPIPKSALMWWTKGKTAILQDQTLDHDDDDLTDFSPPLRCNAIHWPS